MSNRGGVDDSQAPRALAGRACGRSGGTSREQYGRRAAAFAAPVVGVGASGGYVYVGDLTGSIYRVKA